MKLIKKLLPIATIASTACVVAPTIASCSSAVFSSSDLGFKPANQHITSQKQLKQAQIVEEYFAKPQYFIEDLAYHRLSKLNAFIQEWKKDERYSNISGSALLSINSVELLGNVEKWTIEGNEGLFDSYGIKANISLAYKANYQYTITVPEEGLGEGIEKDVTTTWEEEDYSIDINNCFVYLYFNSYKWEIGIYVNKDLDWSYTIHSSHNTKEEFRVTKSGKEEVSTHNNVSQDNTRDSRGLEANNYCLVLEDDFYGTIVSYYLEKVIPYDEEPSLI